MQGSRQRVWLPGHPRQHHTPDQLIEKLRSLLYRERKPLQNILSVPFQTIKAERHKKELKLNTQRHTAAAGRQP